MNRRNKLIVLLISVLTTISLVGCASQKPEDVVSESLTEFKDKNFAYFETQEEIGDLTDEEFNEIKFEEIKGKVREYAEAEGITINDDLITRITDKLFDYNFSVGESQVNEDNISALVPTNIDYYDIEANMQKALDEYEKEGSSFSEKLEIVLDKDKQSEEVEKVIERTLTNDIRNTKEVDFKLDKIENDWVLEEPIMDTIWNLQDLEDFEE